MLVERDRPMAPTHQFFLFILFMCLKDAGGPTFQVFGHDGFFLSLSWNRSTWFAFHPKRLWPYRGIPRQLCLSGFLSLLWTPRTSLWDPAIFLWPRDSLFALLRPRFNFGSVIASSCWEAINRCRRFLTQHRADATDWGTLVENVTEVSPHSRCWVLPAIRVRALWVATASSSTVASCTIRWLSSRVCIELAHERVIQAWQYIKLSLATPGLF